MKKSEIIVGLALTLGAINSAFAGGGQCAYLRDFSKMIATKRDEGVPKETIVKSIYMLDGKGVISDGDAEAKIGVVNQIYGVAAGLSPADISALYYGNCKTAEISRQ